MAVLLLSMALTISAQQVVSGNYLGQFTRIYMNGEKKVGAKDFTAKVSQSGSSINLHIDAFKLGRMPGNVTIDANNIVLKPDGSFSQTVDKGIFIKILWKRTAYSAKVSGKVVNNVLNFTVTSINASYLGISFTASISFKGTKQA